MKTRKTIILAALVAVSGLVIAQGFGGGMGGGRMSTTDRAKTEADQLKTTLSLSADQASKIQAISLNYAQKDSVNMAAMMAGGEGGQMDFTKMQADRAATAEAKSKEYNALLTPDQQAKYKTYLAEQEAARQQRMQQMQQGGGMGGFGGGAPQ